MKKNLAETVGENRISLGTDGFAMVLVLALYGSVGPVDPCKALEGIRTRMIGQIYFECGEKEKYKAVMDKVTRAMAHDRPCIETCDAVAAILREAF